MKRITIAFGVALTISTLANAQTRNCGTMENLQLRKQQDPTLEKRITDDETKIQQWISQHSQEKTNVITFPSLPGFNPTGNVDADRISYGKAKEEYVAANGVFVPHIKTEPKQLEAMRQEKANRYHAIH